MTKLIESLAKNMRSFIGASVVYLSFGFLFSLLFVKIPPENKEIVNISAGLVLAGLGAVLTYYYGSSKDKSDSDKATIAKDVAAAGGDPNAVK